MSYEIPSLATNTDGIPLGQLIQQGQENASRGIQLNELQRTDRVQQTVRRAIARHTVVDPQTGPHTDHRAVAAEIAAVDPRAAETYLTEVATRQRAEADRDTSVIATALQGVNENGDQEAAARQYAEAVRMVQSHGVTVPPELATYSRDHVTYMRRMLNGAEHTTSDDSANMRAADTLKEKVYEHDNPSADNTLDNATSRYNTDVQEEGRNYRHATPSADAQVRANATTEAAGIRAGDGAPISFLPGNNPGPSSGGDPLRGSTGARAPTEGGRPTFLPAGVPTRNSSPPGSRARPMRGASTNHPGDDWTAPEGTPILAEQPGEVVSAGRRGGYGNQVAVRYADGSEVSYSHASRLLARPGQKVARGQPIALVGQTGTATGPHVHRQEHEPASAARVARSGAPMEGASSLTDEPQPRQGRPRPAIPHNQAVRLVAEGVQNYQGPSRLSERAQSAMRMDARFKRIHDMNIEQRLATINSLVPLLNSGDLNTGPGTWLNQLGRRFLQGFENVTGYNSSSPENDRRAAAYEQLAQAGTVEAVEVLRGVGGNDTDRDFSRALDATISNAHSGQYNRRTLAIMAGTLELGRRYQQFAEQWASVTGSPYTTQDGVSMDEAWNHIAGPLRRNILRNAGIGSGPAMGANNEPSEPRNRPTPAPARRAAPTGQGSGYFRGPNNTIWRRNAQGRMERVR